jgi:hypothetical protein
MVAGKYNITCQQGSTFDLLMELQYPDPEGPLEYEEYLKWDLTGYRARMYVKKYPESASPYITLTTENDRIFLNETEGSIRLFIRAEDTAQIPTSGVYDIEIISPSNEIDRVVEGLFNLSKEVTI